MAPYISYGYVDPSDNLPEFSWDPQGISPQFPNNNMYLIFFDGNKNQILKISVGNTSVYKLNQSQWNTILNSSGNKYYVAVSAFQTSAPTTGEYISQLKEYSKP